MRLGHFCSTTDLCVQQARTAIYQKRFFYSFPVTKPPSAGNIPWRFPLLVRLVISERAPVFTSTSDRTRKPHKCRGHLKSHLNTVWIQAKRWKESEKNSRILTTTAGLHRQTADRRFFVKKCWLKGCSDIRRAYAKNNETFSDRNNKWIHIFTDEKRIQNALPLQEAALTPGKATASPRLHSPFSTSYQAEEPDSKETSSEYALDHIVGREGKNTSLQFKVRWNGHSAKENTFEPPEKIHQQFIHRFWNK